MLESGSYNFVGYDSNGDGWAGRRPLSLSIGNLTLAVTGSQGSIFFDTNWWGCTDATAAIMTQVQPMTLVFGNGEPGTFRLKSPCLMPVEMAGLGPNTNSMTTQQNRWSPADR